MEYISQLALVIVSFFTLIYAYSIHCYKYWKQRKFPYLTPKFPLGNTRTFLKLTKSFDLESMEFYDRIKENGWKFAGVYTILRPVLVVVDPDYVRDILTKDFDHFIDRGFYYDEKAEPISAHLFALDETQWRNMRVKLTPTFTSGKMKMMLNIIVKKSENLVQAIDECLECNRSIDIKDYLANFTTDVIASCAFGLETNSFDKSNSEFRDYGRKLFSNNISFNTILKMSIATSMPKLAKKIGIATLDKDVNKYFSNLVRKVVKYREQNDIKRPDFLQLLINMKNEEKLLTMDQLIAQVFLFYIAGFDTSSSAMNFALYELSQNEDIQNRLRKEINDILDKNDGQITYDSINEMSYLEKVLKESLRLYPSVPNLQRVCVKEYKMRDTDMILEKGTAVLIPIISIQRDPQYFPEPMKFDPERFDNENLKERRSFVHLPFGEGPRNCIGLRFGKMQSKIGLIQILRNFRISISPETNMPLELDERAFLIRTKQTFYLKAERI